MKGSQIAVWQAVADFMSCGGRGRDDGDEKY